MMMVVVVVVVVVFSYMQNLCAQPPKIFWFLQSSVLFLSFLVICRKSSWYKHDIEVDKISSLSEIWFRHSDVIETPCFPGHDAGFTDKVINVAVPWNSGKIYQATRGNSLQYYCLNCWLLSDDWKKMWTFISVFARWKFDGTGAF